MACDIPSLVITRERPPGVEVIHELAESKATYRMLEEERERLHDYLPDVLTADSLALPALPDGASTYASFDDGVSSLMERLALFERVYIYMPFSLESFRDWALTKRSIEELVTSESTVASVRRSRQHVLRLRARRDPAGGVDVHVDAHGRLAVVAVATVVVGIVLAALVAALCR